MNHLSVAVVGLGKMGLVHASILNSMTNVEVVGICDKSHLLLKLAKKLFKKVQAVDKVEKFVNLDLNSVYVTTPIPSHYPIIKTLLSNRIAKNIFVEKTLTTDSFKSKELCELVQNFEGINMVGYMKRYAVTFAKAKEILLEGVLGKVVSFEAYAYSSDFANVNSGSRNSKSRGGVLSDLGSHVIDLALWFFGDFKVVSSSLKSDIGGICKDSVDFTVNNSSLIGHFRVSWCIDNFRLPIFGLVVKGNNGVMEVNDYSLKLELSAGKSFTWFKHDLGDNVNFLLGAPEYYREDKAFINSILTGCNAEPSFEMASKVDYIVDQVKKEAIKSGV